MEIDDDNVFFVADGIACEHCETEDGGDMYLFNQSQFEAFAIEFKARIIEDYKAMLAQRDGGQ